MAGWDDVSTPASEPPAATGWDAVSTPIEAPKMPDTSGVQKMAADNLAANENTNITPTQKLDTAMGMPVSSMLKGDSNISVPASVRGHYIDSLQKGTASNFGDFMQTTLHSITPLVMSGIQKTLHPIDSLEKTAEEIGSAYTGMIKGGAAQIAYPFLSEENKQELLENGTFPALTDYKNTENSTLTEKVNRGLEIERATVGTGMGALYAPVASVLSPVFNPVIESTEGIAKTLGASDESSKLAPKAIGAGMDILGGFGLAHGAGELRAARPSASQFSPGAGPWEHPSSQVLKDIIATDKRPADAIGPNDIDHHIAQGANALGVPTPKDFQDVATVTGTEVSTLHVIFKETGVKPDQVFDDMRKDPEVAQDVADGKVPEAYEHLIEESKVKEPEKLQVSKDEASRSFNVIDEEGEHIQGGFNSAQEAREYISDKKIETIGDEPPEWKNKKEAQSEIPGTEKISDRELAERKMEGAKQAKAPQKPADEGLFDVSSRGQTDLLNQPKTPNVIPPSSIGKPTSLRTFLSNNGAKFNEAHELVSMKKNGERLIGEAALEHANELAKEHGYLSKEANETDLQNTLSESGGRNAFREEDAGRVEKARENLDAKKWKDPVFIEDQAQKAGIDTEPVKGETEKQRTSRLLRALEEFYKEQGGEVASDFYRKIIGDTIIAAEKFVGKLTGGFFGKLGEAYIKTFSPELMGDKALRADAYVAKFKTAKQEAENAFYRQSEIFKRQWDKKSTDERMKWLYDHETGRWTENDVDHVRYQSLLDSTFKAEKEAIGADADKGYKENYLPHVWENPEAVKEFFNSDAMMKKYGKNGFTKASTFQLIQDGVRAGFKLRTDNPESMLVARLLAGHDMIATMDLLKDMESSGLAKKATAFSWDKKIAKTESALADLREKYQAANDKINDPKQERWDFADPAVNKYMKGIEDRISELKSRLDDLNKEKSENKLSPEQMKEVKGGFKIIGPDSHVWNIHPEIAPLWKNAMESKGLWENQGVVGDAYRFYTGAKNAWTGVKLALSLFHPVHVAMIHLASGSEAANHLIQGGKFSDLSLSDTGYKMGVTGKNALLKGWDKPAELRTPEEQYAVKKAIEGGFKPTLSARDTIHFRENFDKAINGIGLNNLRLLGTVLQIPGKLMSPFMEHWIPNLKSEVYDRRTELALKRDPSLIDDAGRRGEVFRQITKDVERTYGEMNQDVQFWNKAVRDSFNAAYISGGWKLAQIYNARGLLQPLNIAYKFAKTGEFSKADITYNMLNAYAYTGLTLALGAAINTMLGNPVGTAKDDVWEIVKNLVAPKTGDKNPDGTDIRLQQPAFAKEAYMLAKDINTKGLISGAGSFIYHTTLIPGIVDTLNNQDFAGRPIISDPTDLHQWTSAGWDAISPISVSQYEKAEQKGSETAKVAGLLGFPTAGAYMNQTPFEQKVIALYDEQNPPKGDAYQVKLKSDLKSADTDEEKDEIKDEMKKEGMTDRQISNAEKTYTKPFVEVAWKKLSAQDQKRLIESASPEERAKYRLKNP